MSRLGEGEFDPYASLEKAIIQQHLNDMTSMYTNNILKKNRKYLWSNHAVVTAFTTVQNVCKSVPRK